ncbi:MAG TPA: type II toxin-antitoxin system VapC family toxin [Tetrasphaera sp.]|uniref:type II toxin-antitoxin system VapC family toxin n=1 Tax=Nostocoides sp. TaxID=1917966 RepID=UPI002BAFA9CF|nr:type II toxin-antitoxin system VapC family toxin [Tetrasphaera sp.]HNQ07763.1 type II toxin-antitoxin system VapC family toxin [Tetrasphaera sp.]
MGRRLILDTNALSTIERDLSATSLDDDDLAVAALTIAQYRAGIELAETARRAADRSRALAAIQDNVAVLDYTEATAAAHARLLAHVHRAGQPRSAHDLIIAAHAVQTGRTILSNDARARFGDLPAVVAVDLVD